MIDLQVLYKSHSQAEWYDGVVTSFTPDSEKEPFLIKFDDGEEEAGRIGHSAFRPKQRPERPYKWLNLDTGRPTIEKGATQQSSQAPTGALHHNSEGQQAGKAAQEQPAQAKR